LSDDAFHTYLIEKSSAVDAFVERECAALARRVIWRAMRIEASGWHGSDYIYKTLWDEYCHFAQYGDGLGGTELAEEILENIIVEVTEKLPRETFRLISLAKAFDRGDDEYPHAGVNLELITAAVFEAVNTVALNRDLEHLGPHRNEAW
jgi:hypothetical protein